MSEPLVSILIPSFNSERFLAQTVESALAQSWARKEIIIVDDGSRDDSLRVARRYESSRVNVLSQENQGGSAARNRAFSCAQGDYIQWLDADDLLHPDKVRVQIEAASTDSRDRRVLLTGPFGVFLHRPWKARFIPTALWQDLSPVDWIAHKFNNSAWMNPAIWLVSRDLAEIAGPWNETLARDQDGEYVCRVVSKSHFVKYVAGAISFYRTAAGYSVSRASSWKAYESILRSTRLCIGYLLEMEDSQRTRAACITYLQAWLSDFYPEFPVLMEEIKELAEELGGTLDPPQVPRKYRPLVKLLGPAKAKKISRVLPAWKWSLWERYERVVARMSRKQIAKTIS